MDRYEYSVPKVSIDGESHGDLLLIAIGSGAIFAVIILIILTSLIRHKKTPQDTGKKDQLSDNFTLAPCPSDSGISNSSSQKSNLMFKFFGKSLSSFDLEKSSDLEMKSSRTGSLAINIDHHNEHQFYRQNILSVSDIIHVRDADSKSRYIQTIAC